MHRIFEFLTESIGWLQIAASPLLVGLGIGALVYFPNPNLTRLIIGASIAMSGLIIGIILATRIWKKKGTISFLSKIMATPELDKKKMTSNLKPDMIVEQEKGILNYSCGTCKTLISLKHPDIIHSGFNNTGFMYCRLCGKVITWSSFDKHYETIVGQKHPWMLTESEKEKIENSVINCDCGGRFSFLAKPRCLTCKTEVPIDPNDIYFYILNGRLDGEKVHIWKNIIV